MPDGHPVAIKKPGCRPVQTQNTDRKAIALAKPIMFLFRHEQQIGKEMFL
jgi:hypothetical protein